MIRLPPWTPDLPEQDSPDNQDPGLLVATNVYPDVGSYKSFAGPSLFTLLPMDGKCRGAFSFFDNTNTARIFAGTYSSIYNISVNIPTIRSTGHTMKDGDWWEFVRYGEFVFATNGTDPIQALEI